MKVKPAVKGLALSLVMHGLLFVPLLQWTEPAGMSQETGSLAASEQSGGISLASLQLEHRPKPAVRPRVQPEDPSRADDSPEPPVVPQEQDMAATGGPAQEPTNAPLEGSDPGGVMNLAMSEIRAQLQKNLIYPDEARSKSIEGKVIASFHLSQEGRLSDIAIETSSGNRLLDMAAMQTLRRMRLKLQMDAPLQITLPILFTLNHHE